jgi:tRNA threonylcarbamoyladenosine biosynthesis protein TsaB
MKILGIDTSTNYCGASLFEDDKYLGEYSINVGNFHDQKLVSMISNLLHSCNESLDSIELISISIGPGSFTGLRIGLSVAKGLAISKDKKITGISTLDAFAYRYYITHPSNLDNIVCSLLDAKRDEVYYAIYKFDNEKKMHIKISDFRCDSIINLKNQLHPKTVILGDAVKKISNLSDDKGLIYDFSEMSRASANSIALLGYENAKVDKFDDIETLEPIYLKEFIPILKHKENEHEN